jgi:hypothetical protein
MEIEFHLAIFHPFGWGKRQIKSHHCIQAWASDQAINQKNIVVVHGTWKWAPFGVGWGGAAG